MVYALNTAATGMKAQEQKIAVISNNLANVSTNGFNRQRIHFEDLVYRNERRAGINSSNAQTKPPTGIQVGLGVKTGAIYSIHEQGQPLQTHGRFDLAINGKGYFRVEMPDGSFNYTRDGSFGLNADGEIVDRHGYLVSPGIVAPLDAEKIDINENGEVYAKMPGVLEPELLGQIPLFTFINENGLEHLGDNLVAQTDVSGEPVEGVAGVDDYGRLMHGWVETSNVNPVTEITELITAQRGYELNSQLIKAHDEILQTLNGIKR